MDRYRYLLLAAFLLAPVSAAAALSCSLTTAAACQSPAVPVLRLSGSSNAHAELPGQSTAAYAGNVVCCSGATGLGTSCTGTFAVVAKLSGATNAHVQQSSQTGYAHSACLSLPAGGSVSVAYQANNCTGHDTTVASLSGATNAQIGDAASYATKICASATVAETLSFSLSDASIGFGALTPSGTRYATGDLNGSGTETTAHTMTASTTAATGYTITVEGPTLASGGATINAIGGTNTAPVASIEQFGLRMTASGGSGTVSSPYAAPGFAYAGTSSPSQVAATSAGDGADTTYSVRYVANIAPETEAGTYTTGLTYAITSNF